MKIGTIGTGFITDWVMGQVLEYEENEYIAVYSRKEETAKPLSEKYHVSKIYTNLDDMMNDDEIDTIYIASPNHLHYEHACMAMRANKNVIVEKPFASNVEECKAMIQLSKESGCFLFEAITTIYNPNYLEIKKRLPEIQPIHIVECNMSQYSRKYDSFLEGNTPNVFTLECSGGALMDINIYNLHYVIGLFGKPMDVFYFANKSKGIDTSGILVLKYDSFTVTCVGSKDNIGEVFTQIQGEKGYILSKSAASMTKNVTLHKRGKEIENIDFQQHEDCHYYYIGEMMKIIKENNRKACDDYLQHSLDVMEVVDQAKRCANLVFGADIH